MQKFTEFQIKPRFKWFPFLWGLKNSKDEKSPIRREAAKFNLLSADTCIELNRFERYQTTRGYHSSSGIYNASAGCLGWFNSLYTLICHNCVWGVGEFTGAILTLEDKNRVVLPRSICVPQKDRHKSKPSMENCVWDLESIYSSCLCCEPDLET